MLLFLCLPAHADEPPENASLPIPRFVNLGASKVNLRQGPDRAQPILWVYQRNGLPVKVVAEFDNWRKIEDIDGVSGWVQSTLLSGKARHGIVLRPPGTPPETDFFAPLRALPDAGAPTVARAEAAAVVEMTACEGGWVKVAAGGHKGWIERRLLWGLLPEEPELCKPD